MLHGRNRMWAFIQCFLSDAVVFFLLRPLGVRPDPATQPLFFSLFLREKGISASGVQPVPEVYEFFTHISAHFRHAAAFLFSSAKGAIKDPSPAVVDAVIAAQPSQRNSLLSCMLSFGFAQSSSAVCERGSSPRSSQWVVPHTEVFEAGKFRLPPESSCLCVVVFFYFIFLWRMFLVVDLDASV